METNQKVAIGIMTGAVAIGGYFIAKAFIHPASKYQPRDVIACHSGDDVTFYTVLECKFEGEWYYYLALGKHSSGPISGWYPESSLWTTNVECYLYER